ncbi:MAG: hypothetical protein FJ102_18770 [Deltaproteobacteria bacterium]|nr:hypothetical protein [Deltaproteobacteria bacterium]
MKLDPLALLGHAINHLKANPEGHVLVAVSQFVLVNVMTFAFIFCGLCGGLFVAVPATIAAAGSGASSQDAEAIMALSSLLVYPLIFGAVLLILPIVTMLYVGYQCAALDEIDGKDKVKLAKVGSVLTSAVGAIVAITLLQCGASLVGVMLCYVGVFLTALPFKWAHLIRYDRKVGTMDALGLAWDGFMANPTAHFAAMAVEMVLSMVLAYIPLIGPMVLWPVVAVFDAMAYREVYPRGATATTPA